MKGIGASPGYAIGKVMIKNDAFEINKYEVSDFDYEIERLKGALGTSLEQIKALEEMTKVKIGDEEAEIFAAHGMILDDPELHSQIIDTIKNEKVNVEWATKKIADMLVSMFEAMDNEYMKERSADLRDVTTRLIKNLSGVKIFDFNVIEEPVVLIAHDLTPSDTAQIPKDKVLGFITEIGGPTSHTAIMSRTLEIPAVVGTGNILEAVKDGDFIAFNGETGAIEINPEMPVVESYREEKAKYDEYKLVLRGLVGEQTVTLDGHHVELGCNIGSPEDMAYVLENDGEGVGLYRSEFLYMNRSNWPTEEEQFEAYKAVLEGMGDKPVVIRTLDIGGDKHLDYFTFPKEDNPFLGFRAIRYCLEDTAVFKTQLRALLRASAYGNLKIMFPMISSLQELRQAKGILQEVHETLDGEGVEIKGYEVGMMMEIPSAAVISDILAKEVDFFSIGTNDLIQYTTAVDRMNQKISGLYTPYHPALLRLIKLIIENGHKEGIWVGMCGEVAGNPKMVPLLLAMGLDEFSMSPGSILGTRKLVNGMSKGEMGKHLNAVMALADSEEIEKYIDENILN